jgi:hypothetical protein
MLIAAKKEIVYANNSDNKDWGLSRLKKQKENFIEAYNANGQIIPSGDTPEYSWYKRKRKFADVRADLEAQGVDLSRTKLAVQQMQIWNRFCDNYSSRDRMPARNIKNEFTEYEYWINHQNDAEFLQHLAGRGVDIHRTQDVVEQEKNYFDWLDFIKTEKRLPKGQRRKCVDGTVLRVSELDEKQRREDCLYRWQYNIQNDKINCVKYCRLEIKQLVLAKLHELKVEEKRIKAEFRNAARRGTGYLSRAANRQYGRAPRGSAPPEP